MIRFGGIKCLLSLVTRSGKPGYASPESELKPRPSPPDSPRQPLEHKQVRIQKQRQHSHSIVVIGGSAIDIYITPLPKKEMEFGKTNPGRIRDSFGGVGRNIVECSTRLGAKTAFVTALGKDGEGSRILSYLRSVGTDVYPIEVETHPTGRYTHVMNNGKDFLFGVSDMDVDHSLTFHNIHAAYFQHHDLQPETLVLLDSNIPAKELKILVPFLNDKKVRVFYEGIGSKALRIFESQCVQQVNQLKVNMQQLEIIGKNLRNDNVRGTSVAESTKELIRKMVGNSSQYRSGLGQKHQGVIFTKGDQGLEAYFNDEVHSLKEIQCEEVHKTNGAGDSLTGGMAAYLSKGYSFYESLVHGLCASKLTIETPVGESTISHRIAAEEVGRIRRGLRDF